MDSIDVSRWADLEGGVELNWHAQSAEYHISIAVLCPKGLVSHFQTRRAVDGAINSGHLRGLKHIVCSVSCESVASKTGQPQWQSSNSGVVRQHGHLPGPLQPHSLKPAAVRHLALTKQIPQATPCWLLPQCDCDPLAHSQRWAGVC